MVRLQFSEVAPETEIEIRVPILSGGLRKGRLSLHRSANGDRLFSDLRLLPNIMVPALSGALLRLSNELEPLAEEAAGARTSIG